MKKSRQFSLDFFTVSQSKNSNPGTARIVEKMKNVYQPRDCAKTPALAVNVLRAKVASEDRIAYCVALKAMLQSPLR